MKAITFLKVILIMALTLYICLKHDIPQKIIDTLTNWLFDWKEK